MTKMRGTQSPSALGITNGQSTSQTGNARGATSTSLSNVASDHAIGQQLQAIVLSIKKLEAMQASDTQQIRQDFASETQQIRQDLAMLKKNADENAGCTMQPRDCYDVKSAGANSSGVYTIFIGPTNNYVFPLSVYCDMETDGGGWTVFQRRRDGSEDFYRTWNEYADGFGNLFGEFWLGNNNLFIMTRNKRYKLRVDLADFDGNSRYADYSEFRIGSAYDKYKLISVGSYSGNAGNGLSPQAGQKFSTRDQDNDVYSGHCSVQFKGAWWYSACHESNLNGYYYGGQHTSYADGVNWSGWRGQFYSLRFTEMKIRPNN